MFINGITDYDRSGNEVKTGLVIAKATCDGDIRITSNGKEAVSVRVRLNNPGTVSDAVTASAIIGSYSSYGQAPVSHARLFCGVCLRFRHGERFLQAGRQHGDQGRGAVHCGVRDHPGP